MTYRKQANVPDYSEPKEKKMNKYFAYVIDEWKTDKVLFITGTFLAIATSLLILFLLSLPFLFYSEYKQEKKDKQACITIKAEAKPELPTDTPCICYADWNIKTSEIPYRCMKK